MKSCPIFLGKFDTCLFEVNCIIINSLPRRWADRWMGEIFAFANNLAYRLPFWHCSGFFYSFFKCQQHSIWFAIDFC